MTLRTLLPLAFFSLLWPGYLLAQAPPVIICDGLPGCGEAAIENVLFEHTVPTAIGLLINLAAGGSVIFIVVAGAQMLLSAGDEGMLTKARYGVLFALLGLALALASQSLVEFVATEEYGQSNEGNFLFGGFLPSVVRIALLLLNATFMLVIMAGGIRMALSSGKQEEFTKGLSMIKWAIVGAVIINVARAGTQALLLLGF